jgi:hypothetical protein
MHIGLDFDNTIVSYDSLFHKAALEAGIITKDVPVSKVSIRDHLRLKGQESAWTKMQGYVYGARMGEAVIYPGVIDCLMWARSEGITMSIISHKTRFPFQGERYDLHEAATKWIEHNLTDTVGPLIESNNIFFEATKEAKVRCIRRASCDVYVDDLPEILVDPAFPEQAAKILFDPDNHHLQSSITRARHWTDVANFLKVQWKSKV